MLFQETSTNSIAITIMDYDRHQKDILDELFVNEMTRLTCDEVHVQSLWSRIVRRVKQEDIVRRNNLTRLYMDDMVYSYRFAISFEAMMGIHLRWCRW